MSDKMLQCRCDKDNFVTPFWPSPRKGELRTIREDHAAHLASAGMITILKVEPEPEKKLGSAARAGRPSKPRTSRSSAKKPTKS